MKKTSTTLNITWSDVDKDLCITWNTTLSQECRRNNISGDEFVKDGKNSSHVFINGLEVFTAYEVRVCIIDLNSCSVSIVTTDQEGMCIIMVCICKFVLRTFLLAPSAAPKRLSLNESYSTSLTMQWKPVPCADRNGIITGYVVMHRRVGHEMFHTENVTGNVRELKITGLDPSTEYEVKVAAVTVVGVGPYVSGSFNTSGL